MVDGFWRVVLGQFSADLRFILVVWAKNPPKKMGKTTPERRRQFYALQPSRTLGILSAIQSVIQNSMSLLQKSTISPDFDQFSETEARPGACLARNC
jgi:hypothetical protein